MKLSLIALSLSFAVACGGSSAPAPVAPVAGEPATATEPAVAADARATDYASMSVDEIGEATLSMMQAMAQTVAEHEGDCDAQADGLQAVIDDNRDLMAAGREADKDEAKKREFEEKFGPRAMEIMGGMMPMLMACQDNEKLQQVFQSFE